MPLSHRPGQAQVDSGATLGVIGGVECKIHFFVMSWPHSDAIFVKDKVRRLEPHQTVPAISRR